MRLSNKFLKDNLFTLKLYNKSDFKECRTNYETVCEMESSTGTALELNTYGKIYKAVHEGATKVQLKELQDIELL